MAGREGGVERGEGGREGEGGGGEEQDDPDSVSVKQEVWLQQSYIHSWRLGETLSPIQWSLS